MDAPNHQQLIGMLEKAESQAVEGGMSVAELLTSKFANRFPHIRIGRPGRFLETVRQISGPIKHQLHEMLVDSENQKCDMFRCV